MFFHTHRDADTGLCTAGPYLESIPVISRDEEGGWGRQMYHPCLRQGAYGPASSEGMRKTQTKNTEGTEPDIQRPQQLERYHTAH